MPTEKLPHSNRVHYCCFYWKKVIKQGWKRIKNKTKYMFIHFESTLRKQHDIPDKIRNAASRTGQLSGRSQVMGHFRLYSCKCVSGTAA